MNLLRLFRFLARDARASLVVMLAAGAVAGLAGAGLLALISRAVLRGAQASSSAPSLPTGWLVAAFVALVCGRLAATYVAQLRFVAFAQDTLLRLSMALCERIAQAPLRVVERHGAARILSTLTDDVGALTWALQVMPQVAMNCALVVGCGLYLTWLAWPVALVAAALVAVGAVGYWALHRRAFEVIVAARGARTQLFTHFRGLTEGIKELMLSRARRADFFGAVLKPAADTYRTSNFAATRHYARADAWANVMFYLLIGVILFAIPAMLDLPAETLTAYVFGMLYLLGPLWSVINAVPTLTRGQVALREVEALGLSLDDATGEAGPSATPPRPQSEAAAGLCGAEFVYDAQAGERAFHLGPIDFSLERGEIVFVTGGNGSGKSTFLKVLTGLYVPHAGSQILDGKAVAASDLPAYRERFSAVFFDFHLFDDLLGIDARAIDERAGSILRTLHVDDKVAIHARRFSTVALSQGQRKRLALAVALLEDRPFYVFDEWAADQDPEYKEIFYKRLLPQLRARGKGVVVVTHDDRYFGLGDRIVRLDEGRIVSGIAAPLPA
jgi:putative ATP-binding cassette transporter